MAKEREMAERMLLEKKPPENKRKEKMKPPGTSSGPRAPGTSSGPRAPGTSSGPSSPGTSSGPSSPGTSSGPSAPGTSSGPSAPGTSSGPRAPGTSSNSPSGGPSAPGTSSNSPSGGPSAPGTSSSVHSVDPMAPKRKVGRPRKIKQGHHVFPVAPSCSDSSHIPSTSALKCDIAAQISDEPSLLLPKSNSTPEEEQNESTPERSGHSTLVRSSGLHPGDSTLVRSVHSVDSMAPKRKRRRPPRVTTSSSVHSVDPVAPQRKRRRPPRVRTSSSVHSVDPMAPKRKVGRPRKIKQDHHVFPVAPSSDSSHIPPTSALKCDIAAQISDEPSLLVPKSNATPEEEQNESTPERAKSKRPPTVTLRQFQELIQHRHGRTREPKGSNDGAESQEEVSSQEESARESELERESRAQMRGKGEVKTIGTVHGFPFDQNPHSHRIITAETRGPREADRRSQHEEKQQGHQSQNKNYILSESVTEKEGEELFNFKEAVVNDEELFNSKEAVVNDVPSEATCQVADNGGEMGHPDEALEVPATESDTQRPADTRESDTERPADTQRPADTRESDTRESDTERPADTRESDTERPADTQRPADTRESDTRESDTERPADTRESDTQRPADTRESDTQRPADTTEDYIHRLILMLQECKLSCASSETQTPRTL